MLNPDISAHVFFTSAGVLNDETRDRLSDLLPPDERRRAGRFTLIQDRDLHIVAHALLAYAILTIQGKLPGNYARTIYGKPELNQGSLSFSLSHTRGIAACALVRNGDVGVDIERFDRSIDVDEIADFALAPRERVWIDSLSGTQRAEAFFSLWTMKEAFVKATGRGFTTRLSTIAISVEEQRLLSSETEDPRAWQFARWRPIRTHRLALALRRPPGTHAPIRVHRLNTESLLAASVF